MASPAAGQPANSQNQTFLIVAGRRAGARTAQSRQSQGGGYSRDVMYTNFVPTLYKLYIPPALVAQTLPAIASTSRTWPAGAPALAHPCPHFARTCRTVARTCSQCHGAAEPHGSRAVHRSGHGSRTLGREPTGGLCSQSRVRLEAGDTKPGSQIYQLSPRNLLSIFGSVGSQTV